MKCNIRDMKGKLIDCDDAPATKYPVGKNFILDRKSYKVIAAANRCGRMEINVKPMEITS